MAMMTPEQFAEFVAKIPAMKAETKVKLYLKIRQAKSAAQKVFDAHDAQFKEIMAIIENHLLADADKAGVKGFTTDYGTTYTAETSKISIADDTAFEAFLLGLVSKNESPFAFFERRVSSTHVANFMKLNGEVPPPGLNIFRERVMRVRKANEK